MKLFLLLATILAYSVSTLGQETEQQVNFLGDPIATKVRVGDSYRMYYSWDIGFCYLTAVDSIGLKRAWVTVAHLFAERSSVCLEYVNNTGEQKTWYLNGVRYLGHDLCQVTFGHDTISAKIDLPWPGSGVDTAPIDFTALIKNEVAYSLVDHKNYNILAIFSMLTEEGEIKGFVIDRESKPGDCGSGFIQGKDKGLFITIRGLPTDQTIFDPLRDRVSGISNCTLAVHVKHKHASQPNR
ncbi:MAG: hypothetical protein NTZ18_02350 [Candidatus Komeilibacteria bacterium]|nr:hypothetical protein [Candidatus Komeilibacteria bacterium]